MTEPALIGSTHFLAGCISLAGLCVAFAAPKGALLHRAGGLIFVITMLALTSTGLWMSISREILFTVFLSLISFHCILSGWAAAGNNKLAHIITRGSWASSSLIAIGAIWGGQIARAAPGKQLNDLPVGAFYFVAALSTLIFLQDLTYLLFHSNSQNKRITRHVWRMGFSAFLATGIFFFGNNHVLPDFLRAPIILATPVILVVILTVFHAFRTRFFAPHSFVK